MAPEDKQILEKYNTDHHAENPARIIAVGVGGGGSNAVNYMFRQGVQHVAFAVVNTDRQALETSPLPNRLLIGPTTTRGLGAGNMPEIALKAAEESAADIAELFSDDMDMAFITAGMGGGTGTGAGPVVARIAKERGLLTIGIVTIPFMFEGMKKIQKAIDGANEMSKYVDAIMIVNNERLIEIYPDLEMETAFAKADDILSTAASSIAEIITHQGYINLDFNDVNTTLKNGNTAIISVGYGEGENRVAKAIEDALNSPLLKNTDIMSSKRLLFNLYYSRTAGERFKISEIKELTNFVRQVEQEVDVVWGITYDESLGDKVKFTILASGFDVTIEDGRVYTPGTKTESPAPGKDVGDIRTLYGDDKIETMERERETVNYILIAPKDIDNDSIIEEFEKQPTYKRNKRNKQTISTTAAATAAPVAPQPQAPANAANDGGFNIMFGDDD